VACLAAGAAAQTFQRLGACPDLGCVFPPDQYVLHSVTLRIATNETVPVRTDFLAGSFFDIRLEVHSPINGSEARVGEPDPNFTFTISKKGEKPVPATKYFDVAEPKLERWDFKWYEGKTPLRFGPIIRVIN
jgi:hypothetical protein